MGKSGNWLVVFNCTTLGLANCLRLLAPGLEVEAADFGSFNRDPDRYRKLMLEVDLVVTTADFAHGAGADCFGQCAVQTLPFVYFDAYHPDLCFLQTDDGLVKGAMGDYHSKIIAAAFQRGIPRARVKALFNAGSYETLGYFDRWDRSRRILLQRFNENACDIGEYFPGWDRHGIFMHSVNHPSIGAIFDIARALLDARGIPHAPQRIVPHDNLLNSAIYPVYDEIAEALSVPGSYSFKLPRQYRCIDLQQFIDASYDCMEALAGAEIRCNALKHESFDRVLATA